MYTEKWGHIVPMAAPGTVALTTTGVLTPTYAVISQCVPSRLCAVVTTAVSGAVGGSLQFIYRPTPGSSSSQVVLGTLNFLSGQAAGTMVYKDITDVSNLMAPGGQLVFNVSVAATNAGNVVPGVEVTDSPINVKALSQCVASS